MGNATETRHDARLDEVVRDAQEELVALREETARYRTVFDSSRLIVGHEFAKPLASISGYLELLEERIGESADEKERIYFAKIRLSIAHLEDLVESVVQMLRLEKGGADLEALERIDLAQVIDRVRKRFEERDSRITVEVEGQMPPMLIRRRCLEVVLENLISNAIKHGGEASAVHITARLAKDRRGEAKGDLLVMAVEDHGAGIPEDKLEAIFTPFFRIESGAEKEGLGLGLALVKSVITIMKGEIHVQSKPGTGTTVTFLVPITQNSTLLPDTVG
jgi:signal transduction histidine kinase